MTLTITGRDAELRELEGFVEQLAGGPASLVLVGEAGVGKTTLWNAGIAAAEAAGARVLRARPVESEAGLSFAAVGDLLDPVLAEALEPLPTPQRRALSRALVLEEGEGSVADPRAIGIAVLGALRGLSATAPLVLAIDDVQWLDGASTSALSYAARRVGHEPIGLLLARRVPLASAFADEVWRAVSPDRRRELTVGPLPLEALHYIVREHLDVVLPRPLLAEVHAASAGNPFYALEIVRTLRRSGVTVEAGQPLPVPESLHDLVHARLLALPPPSRDYLLAAAAHAHPTVNLTEAASGIESADGLRPALEARVVELEGERIRFAHPLLAAGAYEIADGLRRAEVHARLAELLEDPEARGWQLAAATDGPDEEVAGALEDAARHARMRGAPRPAALLLDRARELTPADRAADAHRRAVDAAYLHFESGDSQRAETQLRGLISQLAAGTARARALVRLARVRSYRDQREAAELFLQAIDEADDRETLAVAHEGVAACLFRLRERLADAVEHARHAASLALEVSERGLAAEATGTQLLAEGILGSPAASGTAKRALELQASAEERRVMGQPLFALSVYWGWINELEAARDAGHSLIRRCRELGDESSLPYVLVLVGWRECFLGELSSAYERALEGQTLAEQAGQRTTFVYCLALEALVEAHRGNEDRARATGFGSLAQVEETGGLAAGLLARSALGLLDHSLGSPESVVEWLHPAVEHVRRERFGEPSAMWFVPELVEALTALERLDAARELLAWYEGCARGLGRVSALANCARCRGLLAAQAGMPDEALASFDEALRIHGIFEQPLDRARTLLALGVAQRRAKRRREARATLEEALAAFQRIGAALWAERARAELRRISGRAPAPDRLTPAEEKVAALVSEGKTNREVAAALFLSERTVEGHLSRVFGKLGVRHRTEVAAALAARQTPGVDASNTGDSPVSAEPVAP